MTSAASSAAASSAPAPAVVVLLAAFASGLDYPISTPIPILPEKPQGPRTTAIPRSIQSRIAGFHAKQARYEARLLVNPLSAMLVCLLPYSCQHVFVPRNHADYLPATFAWNIPSPYNRKRLIIAFINRKQHSSVLRPAA